MNRRIFKFLLVPLVVSVGSFLILRPALAEYVLSEFLESPEIEIGEEVVDGYSQVFYILDGEKIYVNKNNQNKRHAYANGDYIVWVGDINGAGQIYRYHIPTGSILQVTGTSTNIKPHVSKEGKVAWEHWVADEDTWQIMAFDGARTTRLTSGDMSVNPFIEGDYIVYGRRGVAGTWRSVAYSISEKESKDIATGLASKVPRLADGKIVLEGTGRVQEFPLNAGDLFLLDLDPLVVEQPDFAPGINEDEAPETTTEEEVLEELVGNEEDQVGESDSSQN